MPKEIVNNRINYCNIYGEVARHDLLLSQGVTQGDSPTFANLTISGDTIIHGNLFVDGNTSILESNLIEFKDNIILLNDEEQGVGVSLNQSGIEIERGTLENYRIVWNEITQRTEVGVVSNLLPITVRESTPMSYGLMSWNPIDQIIESTNTITIPLIITSTINSTSSSSGAFIINGGLGIKKDIFTEGILNLVGDNLSNISTIYTNNTTLNITSVGDINITPAQNIVIPFNVNIILGSSNIVGVTDKLILASSGSIDLNAIDFINIPNQVALTFSTQSEKIYTDNTNNLSIVSSKDIIITPGNGAGTNKVLIPINTPLAFNNVNQSISANISNDLIINANNNILLNPGTSLNVKIPTDNGIKFGGNGNQRITADSNNDLYVYSASDIYLSSNHVNIPSNIPLTFANYNQNIIGDTSGNLIFNAGIQAKYNVLIYVNNTDNSVSGITGSIHTDGGLGVKKDIVCDSKIIINSQVSNSFQVNNNTSSNLFSIDADNNGKVTIFTGDGTSSEPSLEILQSNLLNAQSSIQVKAAFDETPGYMIGRGTSSMNSGRVFSFNLPNYSAYSNTGPRPRFSITSNNTATELFSIEEGTGNISSLGNFDISNTADSFSSSTGSFIVSGGLGVKKNIFTSGKMNITKDSTSAFEIMDSQLNSQLKSDTIAKQFTLNQNMNINTSNTQAFSISDTTTDVLNINTVDYTLTSLLKLALTNTSNSTNTVTGAVVINGGVGINKNLNVGGTSSFNDTLNMLNHNINNVANPVSAQDAATKAYVDLVKQGLYVKDSVMCATINAKDLNSDFTPGSVIDGYTLVLNDHILILYQSNPIENGLYVITANTPIRADDLLNGVHAAGSFVFIKQGVINSKIGFICNSIEPNDIVGTHSITFTEFTGIAQLVAGDALTKNLNVLNVNVDNNSIEINNDNLRLSSNYISTGLTGGSGLALETSFDQSHVTKLGNVYSGQWTATVINTLYGGTGRNNLPTGNILFGSGTNPIDTDVNLFYDNDNIRLGLGTNTPTADIEIKSNDTITLFLNVDTELTNPNARPEINLSYSGQFESYLAMSRNYNEYANNIYPDALILSNAQTDSSSCIQLATNQQSRLTILSDGKIGINTSNPNTTLHIDGTLFVSQNVTFNATKSSNNSTEGGMVLLGGLSINSTDNASSNTNGGGLTVAGGASILKDLYVGGTLYTDSVTFSDTKINSTDEAINNSTGCFITVGGITIQCTTESSSVTNGGSLLVAGGASIGKSLYVGNTLYGLNDTFLGNLYFVSTSTNNYIQGSDNLRTPGSFTPIHFTEYNNTIANIFTINNNGIILNKNNTLQIGGTLDTIDGYNIYYTTSNLNITPNTSNYNINIGTIGSFSNLNIYGESSGQIRWNSNNSNLLLANSTIQLNKLNSSGSIIFTTPNTNSISFIQANTSNMSLSIGGQSSNGELTTILSNSLENSTITFTPSIITNSTLVLTDNINTTFNGPVNFSNITEFSGNTLHQTISNTSGNSLWIYFGQINNGQSGYTEIDFYNGNSNGNGDIQGLKLTVSILNSICTNSHLHYGNLAFNSNNKPICYIYNDGSNNYHLFTLLSPNSQTNINVTAQQGNKYILLNEGTDSLPSGVFSNFDNWTQVYATNIESTLKYTTGDLTIEGKTCKIADNLPIIGYNNSLTTNDRDIGMIYQRYQSANDSGLGNIVNDSPFYIDSLPTQTGIVVLNQLKLSSLASSINDYYNGMWIKIITGANINQVRKIISYNASQKVVTLATSFTSVLPNAGDTVNLYNNGYVTNFFDTRNNTFALSYITIDPNDNYLETTDNANLRLKGLYSTDTTISTNSSSGSINILGGISINNTNDASSSSFGGTITTRGGVGIQKNLLVGNNIGIGTDGFTPQESLHIKKNNATIRVEHNSGNYSYIDFVENNTNNRYGILLDNNLFSLTNSSNNDTPNNSNKALVVNNSGYIGINTTTNITSPLTLNTTNFISTNSSTGYLGLIGGNSNSNNNSTASRILLFANSQNTSISSGSLNLYAGDNGNVSIFTNNDTKQFNISNSGNVSILSTTNSDNSTTGSLVVAGGLSIVSNQNSSSITSGGSITTPGGASIGKDLYIGGDIFITGQFTSFGAVTSPSITLDTLTNCTTFNYYFTNLQINGNLAILTFMFSVIPDDPNEKCDVSFNLPQRTTDFTSSFEVISNCSGYSNETNHIPLFNTLSYAIVDTTALNVTFQSISVSIHNFQVQATYTKN